MSMIFYGALLTNSLTRYSVGWLNAPRKMIGMDKDGPNSNIEADALTTGFTHDHPSTGR